MPGSGRTSSRRRPRRAPRGRSSSNGFGDALITYEQEAIYDKSRGQLKADVVYPRRTILSEHTLVVIDKNVRAEDRRGPRSRSSQFLWSEEAQRIFVAVRLPQRDART